MSFVDDPDDPTRAGFIGELAQRKLEATQRRRARAWWLLPLALIGALWLALLLSLVLTR